jgi:hypothetical protein
MLKPDAPAGVGSRTGAGEARCENVPDHTSHGADNPAVRPSYTLELRPEPGVDGVQALRQVLRRLLRDHGLRCLTVREVRRE